MVSVFEGGRDFTFSNSTVHLTGASATLSLEMRLKFGTMRFGALVIYKVMAPLFR